MAAQPHDLFGHVAALRLECRLLHDAALVHLVLEQLPHALFDATPRVLTARRRALGHVAGEPLEGADATTNVVREMRALSRAGAVELRQGVRERAHQHRSFALRYRRILTRTVEVGDPPEKRQVDLAGQPQLALEAPPLLHVRSRERLVDFRRRAFAARHRTADVDLHSPTADSVLHELAHLAFPDDVFLRQRQLEIQEALIDAPHLDREGAPRSSAERSRRGPESRHALHVRSMSASSASSSAADAVAVPSLPTTMPAARLASTAASSKLAPATSANAALARTVSPAPVTSNTSRAAVGKCCIARPWRNSVMPSSPRDMSTASQRQRSSSVWPARASERSSTMSTPEARLAASRFGLTNVAPT